MDVGPRSCHLYRDGVDLSNFSPSQREVVTAEDGPLSVLAGPGSGKTTVLAGRIAYLVDQRGISPSTIMAITFTTAAAVVHVIAIIVDGEIPRWSTRYAIRPAR